MRPESERKIIVRDTVIGGPQVLICLPLIADERSRLLEQAEALLYLKPDLLEWRVDGYGGVDDVSQSLDMLAALHRKISPTPLIFTCRIESEGGAKKIDAGHRLRLIIAAIQTGHADIVDVEMCNEPSFITSVLEASAQAGSRLILSYHNFDHTPDGDFIYKKLVHAQKLGADIAKLAVMPDVYGDVLTLMNATYRARTQGVRIPIVTVSMGAQGAVSRIAGGLFGSDITFAVGTDPSAPGQLPIEHLRNAMDLLY